MRSVLRAMHLDYHLEKKMRSQMDLKKKELMDSSIVKMKGIQKEIYLNYHLEMTMRSLMDLRKEELMDSMMV